MGNLSGKAIFVVGDVMLDSYFSGRVNRISPEAPIPVLNHCETIYKLGGAANVANNLAHSDIKVRLFGLIGNDNDGCMVRSLVEKCGAESSLLVTKNSRTINKLRISSQGQQIVRVDFEDRFDRSDAEKLDQTIIEQLEACSLLILSDYAKGTLGNVEALIIQANLYGVPVLVDPKGSDFDKYCNATILTPNREEFEFIVGPCANYEEILSRGEELRARLNLNALLVTLSEDGMVLFEKDSEPFSISAIARDIVDVTGAGDTVVAWLARGLVGGKSLVESVIRANVASSIAVSKLGVSVVSLAEVINVENIAQSASTPIHLVDFVSACRSAGETIVFTNGCFDILHEGHVKYLEEAKKLGGKLIVGVNDDASVKRLKGETRPINAVSSRIKVLRALSCIDFVVSFSEETPICLIKEIGPDILVKGGDYLNKEIVGSDYVIERGGTVQTIDFLRGFSTSNIIDAMKLSHS